MVEPHNLILECVCRESVPFSTRQKSYSWPNAFTALRKSRPKKIRLASKTTKNNRTLLAPIDSSRYRPSNRPSLRPQPPYSCMTCFHARICMRRNPFLTLARAFRGLLLSTPPSQAITGDTPARIEHLRIQRCYREHCSRSHTGHVMSLLLTP